MKTEDKKIEYDVKGMHCASCEVYIEQQLLTVKGVKQAEVSIASGKAVLTCDCQPDIDALNSTIASQGYSIHQAGSLMSKSGRIDDQKSGQKNIGAAVLLVAVGVYLLLRYFNITPAGFNISDQTGLIAVLGIGLLASVSTCMAVTGGLLVASSARYSQSHPEKTSTEKIKPLLYFNAGRLFGYAGFGALIGSVGSIFTLSSWVNGLITILASAIMIVLGAQLLGVIPAGLIRPPKKMSRKIHSLTDNDNKFAPAALGAFTFFLPCGFTQALQLYVLAQGGALLGMFVMGTFAIGTLPALLFISFLTSFSKGRTGRYVSYIAGAIAVLAGLIMLPSGLTLLGGSISFNDTSKVSGDLNDPNVKIVNGVQVINMKVDFIDYIPHRFTVQTGMPVEWNVDGTKAAGCMTSLLVPRLGIREFLPPTGSKKITFTPTRPGVYNFSCAMGMGTPGAAIIVVDPKS